MLVFTFALFFFGLLAAVPFAEVENQKINQI